MTAGRRPQPRALVTLGHSPDPDDAFMFYAMAKEKIPTGQFRFKHIMQDIQTLNERARRCELDVTAISFHAYPHVARDYALLPCGASMGDGYGPILISRQPMTLEDLSRSRIAIPGKLTSAFLALQLFLKGSKFKVQSSSAKATADGRLKFVVFPFDRIFDAMRSGKVDVGLIIHEGQLTYARDGFHLILDLGIWWKKETGLPLPLGGNVIMKSLGIKKSKAISRILSDSIRYGLDHLDEAMPYLKGYARDLDDPLTRRFVKMYVNDYTVDYGPTGREAITEFLRQGANAGLVPTISKLEFI